MDCHLQRANIVFCSDFLWQLQHSHKHSRHPLTVSDPIILYALKRIFGFEMLHDHYRYAHSKTRHRKSEGRSVVKRGG